MALHLKSKKPMKAHDDNSVRKLMPSSWDNMENNIILSLKMEHVFLRKHGSMSWLRTK